jgi:hypothetical protein
MGTLDMNLDGVGALGGLGMGRNDEDDRARRLQAVIDILSVSNVCPLLGEPLMSANATQAKQGPRE